jgi:phosphatidylinositol-3-phosphatase
VAGRRMTWCGQGPRQLVAWIALATLIAGAAACGAGTWNSDRGVADSCDRVPAQGGIPGAQSVTRPTKLLVFVIENRSRDEMCDMMRATLAPDNQPGFAMNYHAVGHPSLPNYLAIVAGDTFDVEDDAPPSEHRLRGPTVFEEALANGKSAKVYVEGMVVNCSRTNGGRKYAVRHNPWVYFSDERLACNRYDVPLHDLRSDVDAGRLPNAGLVVPDLCNDGHDCSLATVDAWLGEQLRLVTSGRDWRTGRLAVVVTADEDDGSQDDRVLTTLMHPSLPARSVPAPLTHYSLSRLYSEVLGVPPLREAAYAPSMADAFRLQLAP